MAAIEPESLSNRRRRSVRIRAGLVAAGVAASVLGVSLALDPAPAAAATPCRVPNPVEETHIKLCNSSGSIYVRHRYVESVWYAYPNHVKECLFFESTYRTPNEYDDFDATVCHWIY